jgi:hypothetical protein
MNMSKITVEISEELLREVPLHNQAMVRQIFELGLTQLKIDMALRRYREGASH